MSEGQNTNRPLVGRTALVTGSGRNIGRAIALAFAKAGANVVVNGHRDAAALGKVAGEIEAHGVKALQVMADVSKADEVQKMADKAVEKFGKIDIAVSNVGFRP